MATSPRVGTPPSLRPADGLGKGAALGHGWPMGGTATAAASGEIRTDLLVVGGGVVGLWIAWLAAEAGIDTVLADADAGAAAGGKASLTPVGALAPFPRAPKDAVLADFQAAALMTMPAAVARLEAATGRAVGYRVGGRLMALPDAAARARAEAMAAEGAARFPVAPGGGAAGWRVTDGAEATVIASSARAAGVLVEGVSAQIDTGAYLAALRAAVRRRARLLERWEAVRIGPAAAGWRAEGPAGAIAARRVVLAAGWRAAGLETALGLGAVRPVRGQAAWLRVAPGALAEDMPLIQAPKLYVVHHGGGRVGIGATSEQGETGTGTDARLDDVIARARAVVPALAGATVEARWSGVRPRPPGRLPQIGPVDEALAGGPGLWLATGTYKIGVALAHHAAAGLIAALGGATGALPEAFAPRPAEEATGRGDTRPNAALRQRGT